MTNGLVLNFDARAVAPASVDGGAEQLPVSDGMGHRVIIIGDQQVATKANDGSQMLVFKLEIIDGQYKGLKGDYRLNIGNTSQQARDIAYRQLSALCHAIGVFAVGNTTELYGKPFRAVVVQQSDPKYTEIKGVLTDQGIDPGNPNAGPRPAGTAPAPQPQAAPAPQTFAAPAPATFAAPAPAPATAPAFGQPPTVQPAWTPPPAGGAAPPAPWGQPAAR